MLNYNYMMGGEGENMMVFSWINYTLVMILLAFAIAALWKYINKK